MRERNPVHRGWLYAILVAQEKGDLAPLAQLLRHKEFDLGRGERLILAMLFDRFRLAKKRGAQRTPIGKLSERAKLEIMAETSPGHPSWARGVFRRRSSRDVARGGNRKSFRLPRR